MKKARWAIGCLLCLLLLLAASALADTPKKNTFYISLSAVEDGGEMPADAVMWQRASNKYYLFLPGGVDLSNARVWFDGAATVTFGGETLKSGDRTTALKDGETVRLRFMNKNYNINVMQGSTIPALFISTATGAMTQIDKTKTYREEGSLRLLDVGGALNYDGALTYIKLRGNTSAKFNKKGYTIKLAQKTDLLGMGKAKKWVLTSNARDHALIRNQLTFAMADYVGLPYTPECRQVEVYLNHAYNGVYILQEKVEIGESRVNITDLERATELVNDLPLSSYKNLGPKSATSGHFKYVDIPNDPEDITGGYLVEFESWQPRYADELSGYTTTRAKVIVVKEPEYASKAQMEYISSFMQGYENAIFAADGIDPDTGKRYDEFIDFESLVLKYMLEEISKNCDGNKSSQYYYKPVDSESTVAFAGPSWDYDTTFGDYGRERDSKALLNPEGFYHNIINGSRYWWPQLYAKPEFFAGIQTMWTERYAHAMRILLGEETDESGKILSIQQYAAAIEKSAAMNFILWPMKQSSENIANCGKTFKANIEYLTNYVQKRYEFLEKEWGLPAAEADE